METLPFLYLGKSRHTRNTRHSRNIPRVVCGDCCGCCGFFRRGSVSKPPQSRPILFADVLRARARAWNGAAGEDDAVAAFASEWTFRTRRLSTAPICHRRGQTVDDGQEAYAHEPATAARVSRLRVILNPVRLRKPFRARARESGAPETVDAISVT